MASMEKKEAIENVDALSISSEHDIAPAEPDSEWQPGFRARFPWVGFGSLLGVLLCSVFSVVILFTSNGKSQTQWSKHIAPNILIAVANGIANICLAVAITHGIAIAWWRRLGKGTSIADLNRSWACTNDFQSLLVSLKYLNIIALAVLAAKLTIIDSTLMQRAFSTTLATDSSAVRSSVTGFATRTFPITGTVVGEQDPGVMMPFCSSVLKMWSQTGGIYPNQWQGCDSALCYSRVPGIGFAFDCDEQVNKPINFGKDLLDAQQAGKKGATATLFSIEFDAVYYNGSDSTGNINSTYLSMEVEFTTASSNGQGDCPGTQYSQSCKLWPAIINYPIQIVETLSDSKVSLGVQKPLSDGSANYEDLNAFDRSLQQQTGFEVLERVQLLENYGSGSNDPTSALSGIQLALMMYIKGHSTLSWEAESTSPGYFDIRQMGHSANYMSTPPEDPQSCGFAYANPLTAYEAPNGLFSVPSVVARVNQVMWGLSSDVAKDTPGRGREGNIQAFDAMKYQITIHYQTDFAYMWGAFASSIACILLVLPVYWRFWELGRQVTLNPFEIAYAFRSPVLLHGSSPIPNELMKKVGNTTVQHGTLKDGDGRGTFGVCKPQNVAQAPGQGSLRASWRAKRAQRADTMP